MSEITVQDIQKAIKKCKNGFWEFEKKRRQYWCDICDEECNCDDCGLKGKYRYIGDNKWHFWQGNPEVLLINENINDLRDEDVKENNK